MIIKKIKCQNTINDIMNIEQIINIENYKDEFTLKPNNSLIYLFLSISLNNNLTIFNNTK